MCGHRHVARRAEIIYALYLHFCNPSIHINKPTNKQKQKATCVIEKILNTILYTCTLIYLTYIVLITA